MKKVIDINQIQPDAAVDLGDKSCGDLIIELLKAIKPLAAGQILQVHATDSAASIDIAAWCAMRNYDLLAGPAGEDQSYYFIQKGEPIHG